MPKLKQKKKAAGKGRQRGGAARDPVDPVPSSENSKGSAWAIIATFAALWLVFAVLELTLLLANSATAVRSAQFTSLERASLAGSDLLALGLYLLIPGLLMGATAWFARPYFQSRKWLGRVLLAVSILAAAFQFFLYAGSWGCFLSLDTFMDRSVLAFAIGQGWQIANWIPRAMIYLTLPGTLLGGLLLAYVLPHAVKRLPRSWRQSLTVATLLLIGACAILDFAGRPDSTRSGEMLTSDTAGMGPITLGQQFTRAAANRAGPFARAKSDVLDAMLGNDLPLQPVKGVEVIDRPIIPMQQYLKSIRPENVHKWNVVVLVIESLNPDPLRAYGSQRDVMPNLDSLAADSLVFRHSYTESTHSNYATFCSISSQYPLRSTDMYEYPKQTPYPRVMLYDILKATGYRVGLFSSGNEYWGGMANYWDTGNIDKHLHAGNWGGPTYIAAADTGFAWWASKTRSAGSADDKYTVGEAIKWLDQGQGPFFLYFDPQNSHFPYPVPRDFPRRFSSGIVDFPMTFNSYPRQFAPYVKDLYDDSLNYVDAQIGKLFAHLKEKGLWDNTLIVATGDHGQAFYEHGFASHANALFDECLRVPLIIHAPGLKPGIDETPIQAIDVAPSVLHLLGLPQHPGPQGEDVFDPSLSAERSFFSVVQTPLAHQYAIIRGRYKLMYDARLDAYALFDLVADPGEHHDILAANEALAHSLSDRLMTWRAAQIEYYQDPVKQKLFYPPVLADR